MIDQTEFSDHESESATWIALADLMTGLMAIFLVISLIMMTNQNRKQVVIITAVTKVLAENKIEVVTDPKTGDVSIVNRDLLFDSNSAKLSPRGKAFLDQFVPQYSKAIFSLEPELSDEVVRIVVEGRTSRSGKSCKQYVAKSAACPCCRAVYLCDAMVSAQTRHAAATNASRSWCDGSQTL